MKKKQRMKHSSSSLFCRDFLLKVNARNSFEIPQLSHISINLTSRYIVAEKKHSLFPMVSLSLLSGQHPKLLRAKKSVAGFKLKKNSILGCKLTLRRVKMTSFLDTLALVVLPQIKRDPLFSERTLSEPGVLQLGFTEFLFFPELEKNFELFEMMRGCSIQLHTTTKADFEKKLLFTSYNFPAYQRMA